MGNAFILPEGALAAENEDDWAVMSNMKGVGLMPFMLQGGVITELRTWEGRAIQVLHEQKINMDQLSIQRDALVAHASGLEQAVEDACRSVPELAMLANLPAVEWVHSLAARVCEAWEEMAKV